MTWREQLDGDYPESGQESPEVAYEAAAVRQGASAYLAQEYEPQLRAQETFWQTLTECLGTYGRLAYPPPNFDHPIFTTGYLALKEIQIDKYGETCPVPCVELSLHENDLIYGHFRRRTMYPWLYHWRERDPQQAATIAIRQYYESPETADPHFPYIEMTTKRVSLAGTREATVYRRTEPIRGAYIPGVVLKTVDAPIFPATPPPNSKMWGYLPHWTRLGPPKSSDLILSEYGWPFFERLDDYRCNLQKRTDEYIERRDEDIASLATLTDILRTAQQTDMRIDDHFERTAATEA